MNSGDVQPSSQHQPTTTNKTFRSFYLFSFLVLPIFISIILYKLDPSDPVAIPDHHHDPTPLPPVGDGSIFKSLVRVGSGLVKGPEHLLYDPVMKVMYTGCEDGWIKRVVPVDGSGFEDGKVEVEEVVNTGGRPLGLALSRRADGDGDELIVADAFKGLLKVTKERQIIVLTKEADGEEFKLADGVDVDKDGVIYFTDASSTHTLNNFMVTQLEGRPRGRLLSFDPSTAQTRVLLRDLYFPNGVSLSPHHDSLIFCETMVRMCKRYYIRGDLAGTVEPFINDTFGSPDNIIYDGEGRYWIGLPAILPSSLYKVMNYPVVRKVLIMAEKYIGVRGMMKSGGVLAVDLEGKPVACFYDPRLSAITGGTKIGKSLYMGSLFYDHMLLLNLTQHGF